MANKFQRKLEGDSNQLEYKPLVSAPYRKSKKQEKRRTSQRLTTDNDIRDLFEQVQEYSSHEWATAEFQEKVSRLISAFASSDIDTGVT